MRNKIRLVVFVFVLALALLITSSCNSSKGNNPSNQTKDKTPESSVGSDKKAIADNTTEPTTEPKTQPTGYDDGGIQISTVYYDGQLYELDDIVGTYSQTDLEAKVDELGAKYVGSIQEETNFRWPSQNLEASRLNVSQPIYYNKDKMLLYISDEDGKLRSMTPYHGPLYELESTPAK